MNRSASLLATLLVTTVAGCVGTTTPPMEKSFSASPMAPSIIGAQTDDFRLPESPLAGLEEGVPTAQSAAKGEITELRYNALVEAAQSYGTQIGQAERNYAIMQRLQALSGKLSVIYDFNRVVEDGPIGAGVVVPPVVSRNYDAVRISATGREASVADEYLAIIRPGKITSTVPTWRDYLLMDLTTPERPAVSLLPKTKAEIALFKEQQDYARKRGRKLADREFQAKLDRINQDFKGMLQYRRLVASGMMNRMVLADADFGVTSKDGVMRIGSRVVQIESDASFQSNPETWSVNTVSQRDALIVESGAIPPLGFDFGFE